MKTPYLVRRSSETEAVDCPCGSSKRIITAADNDTLSIHCVRICKEARKHFHKKATEYYVILSGTGEIELDEDNVAVGPGDVVMIPPLTAHVARGDFEIINIVYPPFDPDDEYMADAD